MTVRRAGLPLWLVVALLAPLGLVFFFSLVLAAAIAAGVGLLALLILPLLGRRRRGAADPRVIELDTSEYRHVERRSTDDRQGGDQ